MPANTNVYVDTVNGEGIAILVGDGATPTENFTGSALVNSDRGLTFTADVATADIPNISNLALPAFRRQTPKVISAKIDAGGMISKSAYPMWADWMLSGASKNVKVVIDVLSANPITFTGTFVLTNLGSTGALHDPATATITLESSGPVTRS